MLNISSLIHVLNRNDVSVISLNKLSLAVFVICKDLVWFGFMTYQLLKVI